MKSFKSILETVDKIKSADEQAFWDKHLVRKQKYPIDTEDQFTSDLPKAKRRGDYDEDEAKAVYEATDRADRKSVVVTRTTIDPVTNAKKVKRFIRKHRAGEVNIGEALDPVGRENHDIDNDGKLTKSDRYLHARRRAIARAKAIREDAMNNSHVNHETYKIANKKNRVKPVKEDLNEAFRIGPIKLKDGTVTQLTKESADSLNNLFKQLHTENKGKMEERLLSGTKGFSEILAFAKETK